MSSRSRYQRRRLTAPYPRRSGRPRIPSCTHLSTTAMAKVLGSPPLEFKGKTPRSNLCTWEAVRPRHYHEGLSVDIVPGVKSIYKLAEADGMKSAAKEGQHFGTLTAGHSPWKAAFFVSGSVFNNGLEACSPEHTLPIFGPPRMQRRPRLDDGQRRLLQLKPDGLGRGGRPTRRRPPFPRDRAEQGDRLRPDR